MKSETGSGNVENENEDVWEFSIAGPDSVKRRLAELYSGEILQQDDGWVLRCQLPAQLQGREARDLAVERLQFLTGAGLVTGGRELSIERAIRKWRGGKATQFLVADPGKMRWFHSGVALFLGERVKGALGGIHVPDLSSEFPQASHWMGNYLLNASVGPRPKGETHAVILALIRRASHTFRHYHEGHRHAVELSKWDLTGSLPASAYFGALEAFENCLLQLQMFYDLFNAKVLPSDQRLFSKADGSCQQRAYDMANRIKHAGDYIQGEVDTTPLWMTKDRLLASGDLSVTFDELVEEIRGVADFADNWQQPARVKEELEAKPFDERGARPGVDDDT